MLLLKKISPTASVSQTTCTFRALGVAVELATPRSDTVVLAHTHTPLCFTSLPELQRLGKSTGVSLSAGRRIDFASSQRGNDRED